MTGAGVAAVPWAADQCGDAAGGADQSCAGSLLGEAGGYTDGSVKPGLLLRLKEKQGTLLQFDPFISKSACFCR